MFLPLELRQPLNSEQALDVDRTLPTSNSARHLSIAHAMKTTFGGRLQLVSKRRFFRRKPSIISVEVTNWATRRRR
jgi:hypothetical protein